MRAAIIGGGIIGGGWAARFLLNGWDVSVYDEDSKSIDRLRYVIDQARVSLPQIYDGQLPQSGNLSVHSDLASAVAGADWVQESVSERIDIKSAVLGEICKAADKAKVIGSSTSGLMPSVLADGLPCADRFLVTHPFHPVYLLPVVEIVPSPKSSQDTISTANDVLVSIGMKPLLMGREIDGFIGNRLQEAMWREALWMVKDGIATVAEIDDAIKYGFGLRMAQMGQFETYRILGGDGGMAHFIAQFGLVHPLSKLMDAPGLDDVLASTLAAQWDEQVGNKSTAELERLRDANLVGIIRALRATNSGAGGAAVDHDARVKDNEQKRGGAARAENFDTIISAAVITASPDDSIT
ncbi:3-hydroxyacyl-CoA dehydrogenase NAD-binding domain-containing protein [Mesorhizobium sp. M1334]|uniref:3-hydroxyacyl-CoA dehydrogenase NAD-binding domain-containing protein n=1 Tax=Mesorhizobium sp. M1334 TaxID=2957084 RepID=UPI0033355E33